MNRLTWFETFFLSIPILFFVVLGAGTAHCQERPVPLRGTEGAPGEWMPLEDFRLAVQDRALVADLGNQVRLLTEALSLAHTEIDSRIAAQTASEAEINSLGEGLRLALQQGQVLSARAAAAEAERDAWWRSPFLWAAVGLVVGVVGSVVVSVEVP